MNVGNGNFTFDNVVIDREDGTITFNVQLGNPIDADSAFRVDLRQVTLQGEFGVSYVASLGTDTVDTGSKSLTSVENQFSYSVKTALSELITRDVARDTFVDQAPATSTDTLTLTVRDNDDLLLAATAGDLVVELGGNFKDGNGPVGAWTLAGAGVTVGLNTAETLLTFTVPAAVAFDDAPAAQDHDIVFLKDNVATMLLATKFDVTVKQNIAGITDPVTYVTKADAGQWKVDASTVNVPYLPVGFGLTAQVEISNLGATDAEVTIEAVDQNGDEYGPVVMDFTYGGATHATARAGTVTRASEADIRKAFDIADGSQKKLSVTFNIDANSDDITLVPFYRQNESRINVISDQYKGN
ncbi:hypothetical protein Q3O60_11930 [Alkalimonas collagenimarina]|uniref:Uncharacterized protein n=1 Tax=Alkalimonas collagenimarina TaxID=400390 RepID=A0ABT9H0Q3_9GAMM|nr:hypothetical protein [Alkalimonas collagenimarina]MDP4536902.1 hypothetical protein [Alkalimonas collagenimarina]